MNRTHLEHAVFAVLWQALVGVSTGDWLAGAFAGALFFLGREHAQYEFQLIRVRGLSSVNQLRPWEGFMFVWRSRDGLLDVVAPVLAVLAVLIAIQLTGGV